MGHSLDEVEIVLNDEKDHWRELLPEINSNETWPFCMGDMDMWKSTFSKCWYWVALTKDTRKPVGCMFLLLDQASAEGDEPLYSVGFVYTSPEWRGSGIGMKTFKELMKIVGDGNATLHAALPMKDKYAERFGFDKVAPFLHYYGTIKLKNITPPIEQDDFKAKKLTEVSWEDILAYDKTICPRNRDKFLKAFIWPSEKVFSRVAVDSNNKIVGIACVRIVVNNDLDAGPFYAESKNAARVMIDAILNEDVDKTKHPLIGFHYPSINTMAERLLQELSGGHVSPVPFTRSQFTKRIIHTPHEKVFATTETAGSFV